MVSTMNSAGWPARSIAWRISSIRLTTPVEVSLCTTQTALMRWLRSSARRASIAAGSAPCRQSPGMNSGCTPSRSAISRHKVAKWPVSAISTRFPGAGAGGGVDDDRLLGLEDGADLAQHLARERRELRAAVIDRRQRDGTQ